jgi:glutamyl-tRNA reductase
MTDVKLRRIPLYLIATILLLPNTVFAQSSIIKQQSPADRCAISQNYLKDIQKPRDLRARVDRLQAYRYIHQRLTVFVVRLEKNSQPNAEKMRTAINSLAEAIEQFKDNYELYDGAREKLVTVKNCADNIEDFQDQLSKTRDARLKVSQDVVRVQELLSGDIMEYLKDLQQQLSVSEKEGDGDE